MRATQAQALAAIGQCTRVELQYVYSPGDRRGTRYVVTVDGWQDRVWHGAGTVLRAIAALDSEAVWEWEPYPGRADAWIMRGPEWHAVRTPDPDDRVDLYCSDPECLGDYVPREYAERRVLGGRGRCVGCAEAVALSGGDWS